MPKRKTARKAARKTTPLEPEPSNCPPIPKSFAKLPAELSWAGDAWTAAHALLIGIERNFQLLELASRPGGVQAGSVDTSFLEEMEQAFQTMKRIDPSIDLQGMDLPALRSELLSIVGKLKMLPNAAKGQGTVRRANNMRSKRNEKYAASRKAIREECKKRLKTNPGLKTKPTTLRNRLHEHFLKKGKQQDGYSKSAILSHISDLCDSEK